MSAIQLGADDADGWRRLADEEFLRAVRWDDSADPKLARRATDGDRDGFLRALRKRCFGLGRRADRKFVRKHRFTAAPVSWSRGAFGDEPSHVRRLFDLWTTGATTSDDGFAESWLDAVAAWSEQLPPETTALERLVLVELLRHARAALPGELVWSLWRRLLTASASSQGDGDDARSLPADARLIVDGELPWVTGLFFAGVAGADALRDAGRAALWRHLDEGTDGDGTPRANLLLLGRLPSWLGSLTRASEWAVAADVPLWDDDCAGRFAALVERAAALLTPDGRIALSSAWEGVSQETPAEPLNSAIDGPEARREPRPPGIDALPVLTTAASLAGFRKSRPVTGFLHALESRRPRSGAMNATSAARNGSAASIKAVTGDADVRGGFQSDWAELACLRAGWTKSSAMIAVAHDGPRPRLALSARGQSWLAGLWDLELSIGGEAVAADEWTWNCVCWFTDEDVDYVELQCEPTKSLRIERQVLLSRRQDFAVLADCASGSDLGEFTYRSRLPLAAGVAAEPDAATREWRLSAGRQCVRAFPLAVPDDRVQGTPGSFGLAPDGPARLEYLEYAVPAAGGLFAPIVLDWKNTRRESYADWRRLTVTEDGRKVGGEAAGGYRLRVGNYQLLLYRSLAATGGLRAVLGHHTGHETVIGRFDRTGTVKPLLLVE